MNVRRIFQSGALVLTMLLLNGCVTKKLWEPHSFYEPAPSPNLQLSFDQRKKDVLVQYDEFSERSYKIQRRAYFLYQNVQRLEARRKPLFVSPVTNLMALQIIAPEQLSTVDSNLELYASTATNSTRFTLYSKGHELDTYELPVYRNGTQRASQIALTPLAVTADAVLVGTVVGFVVWAESGFYPFSEQSHSRP